MKKEFTQDRTVFSPADIGRVLSDAVNDENMIKNNKGEIFYNIPASFDIETSSFYRGVNGEALTYEQVQTLQAGDPKLKFEKVAIMYVWQLGINGRLIMGRTWGEFVDVIHAIADTLHLSENKKLIIYIHNLSYEFQFIRELFNWVKVFSIDLRKPIYATTDLYIEFRCSYLLSGYSLAKLGEQLHTYKVKKLVGDLDYHLLRHSTTPLTPKEIDYCVNDIAVVMAYIQEKIIECKGIQNIPLTKTGFVRKYCRKHCLRVDTGKKIKPNWDYINLIKGLQINDLNEFAMLQRAFAGGFTHANANYTGDTIPDVDSYDFTSSYPFVMVSEQFPMSTGVKITCRSMKQFNFLIEKYCCIFDVEFTNIFARETYENPISISKCLIKENAAENNGRLVGATRIVTTITNVDYKILQNFYSWENIRIGQMYCYRKQYLPTAFVKSILHLYELKTKLKGVAGKEVEYLNSKEMLNSCYGMAVTNPLRDEFTYNGVWDINEIGDAEKSELLFKYNTSKNRFLFYPWGVFVTAYARRNLFTGIYEVKDDYIYSDTDSIKLMNGDRHKAYFDAYNLNVVKKLKRACLYHGLSFDLCEPLTIKGKKKLIGVWDYEGKYDHFKTLGAKRYMVEQAGALTADGQTYDFSLTVSGVNKKSAIPYLLQTYGSNGIFDAFSNYLSIPATATGKNIHTYIDYKIAGSLTDYLGNVARYDERTGVHLEPTGYTLSLSAMYLNYLRGIKFQDD